MRTRFLETTTGNAATDQIDLESEEVKANENTEDIRDKSKRQVVGNSTSATSVTHERRHMVGNSNQGLQSGRNSPRWKNSSPDISRKVAEITARFLEKTTGAATIDQRIKSEHTRSLFSGAEAFSRPRALKIQQLQGLALEDVEDADFVDLESEDVKTNENTEDIRDKSKRQVVGNSTSATSVTHERRHMAGNSNQGLQSGQINSSPDISRKVAEITARFLEKTTGAATIDQRIKSEHTRSLLSGAEAFSRPRALKTQQLQDLVLEDVEDADFADLDLDHCARVEKEEPQWKEFCVTVKAKENIEATREKSKRQVVGNSTSAKSVTHERKHMVRNSNPRLHSCLHSPWWKKSSLDKCRNCVATMTKFLEITNGATTIDQQMKFKLARSSFCGPIPFSSPCALKTQQLQDLVLEDVEDVDFADLDLDHCARVEKEEPQWKEFCEEVKANENTEDTREKSRCQVVGNSTSATSVTHEQRHMVGNSIQGLQSGQNSPRWKNSSPDISREVAAITARFLEKTTGAATIDQRIKSEHTRSLFSGAEAFSRPCALKTQQLQGLALEVTEDVDFVDLESEEVKGNENTEDTRDKRKCQVVGNSTSATSVTHERRHEKLVTTIIATLFVENGLADIWTKDILITNTKRLVKRTLQGLTLREDYNPNKEEIRKISKILMEDLKKIYGGKHKLRSAIVSEMPNVEPLIARRLQIHITDHCARAEEEEPQWKKFCEEVKANGNTEDTRDKSKRQVVGNSTSATSVTCERRHEKLVTTIIATLFVEIGLADIWTKDILSTNTKRLVELTLQGLTLRKDYNPNKKEIRKISKILLKDLKETYGSKGKLRSVILSKMDMVEPLITAYLQMHITGHCARVEKDKPQGKELCEEVKANENNEDTRDKSKRQVVGNSTSATSVTRERRHEKLVTAIIAKLFKKNSVADVWTEDILITNTKRLVELTLQGLTLREDYNPSKKEIRKISKTLMESLKKTCGGKFKLRYAIVSEMPKVEPLIARRLQVHITDHCAGVEEEVPLWKEFLQRLT